MTYFEIQVLAEKSGRQWRPCRIIDWRRMIKRQVVGGVQWRHNRCPRCSFAPCRCRRDVPTTTRHLCPSSRRLQLRNGDVVHASGANGICGNDVAEGKLSCRPKSAWNGYERLRLLFARDLWRFTNVLWLIDWLIDCVNGAGIIAFRRSHIISLLWFLASV